MFAPLLPRPAFFNTNSAGHFDAFTLRGLPPAPMPSGGGLPMHIGEPAQLCREGPPCITMSQMLSGHATCACNMRLCHTRRPLAAVRVEGKNTAKLRSADSCGWGAQLLFYPTAIGSEPQDPSLDSYLHWCRVMMGHSGANLVRPQLRARASELEALAKVPRQMGHFGSNRAVKALDAHLFRVSQLAGVLVRNARFKAQRPCNIGAAAQGTPGILQKLRSHNVPVSLSGGLGVVEACGIAEESVRARRRCR